MKKFDGKVCVVTGGALGIGRCIAREFARQGAKAAFIDVDNRSGEENLAYIKKNGGDGLFFHGDVGEETVLRSFAEKVIDTYGKIDFLINNACISKKWGSLRL